MRDLSSPELESLEVVNQDDEAREVILRMARLARGGRLETFVAVLGTDEERTRSWARELASDAAFLFAVEDYVARCRMLH